MSVTTSNGSIAPIAQQTIALDQVPYNIQVPGTYFEVHANYSQAGLLGYPAQALIIGQMLASGSAAPNTPIPIYDALSANAYFGAGSICSQMCAAFIANNPWTTLFAIGVPDAAGATKAAASLTFAGAATAAGTLMLYVQGIQVQTGVNVGDTAATIAGNVAQSLAETLGLDAAATITGDVITLTALQGGTLGNTLDLRLNYNPGDTTPAGVTVTIVPFAGGATDPTITDALNAISETWFTDIVMCWNDSANVALLEEILVTRFEALGKLDSHAYRAIAGTPGTVQAAQASLNSRYASTLAVQNPLNPTWMWAAALAGVASYFLAADPSRQLRGIALAGILAPANADRYTQTERNILLGAGISTFNVEKDGTVALERVVTEYLTSPQGVPDSTWHDIMVPKTMSRIRYDWAGYVSLTYPRNKLADDGTLAAEFDQTVVTPSRLQSSWAGRSRIYAELGWIEHSTALAKQALFVRDQTDPNRVNARQQVQIIGNLMVLAGSLEFSL